MLSDWRFLCDWMVGKRPPVAPPPRQMELIFRHGVAGLAEDRELADDSWERIRKQKNKQMMFSLQAQGVFHKIARRCAEEDFRILPLKGISLTKTIYAQDPSRRQLSDIDFLVQPENLLRLHRILEEIGYKTTNKNMLRPEYQQVKRKVEYLHPNPLFPGLDVHSAFVVKKFLSLHAGFELDAVFDRAKEVATDAGTCLVLDPVDEWLYLAYHYALHHQFSGLKWLMDIYYSTWRLTAEDWGRLLQRSAAAGLDKIVLATLQALARTCPELPEFCRQRPSCALGGMTRTWLHVALDIKTLLYRELNHGRNRLQDKIGEYMWEFLFIDRPGHQLGAILRLLFPSHGLAMSILGIRNRGLYLLIFPLFPLLGLLLLVLFGLLTASKSLGSTSPRDEVC